MLGVCVSCCKSFFTSIMNQRRICLHLISRFEIISWPRRNCRIRMSIGVLTSIGLSVSSICPQHQICHWSLIQHRCPNLVLFHVQHDSLAHSGSASKLAEQRLDSRPLGSYWRHLQKYSPRGAKRRVFPSISRSSIVCPCTSRSTRLSEILLLRSCWQWIIPQQRALRSVPSSCKNRCGVIWTTAIIVALLSCVIWLAGKGMLHRR